MTLDLNGRMAGATRLTRAGRLAEAMALLQGLPQKPNSLESEEGCDREPRRPALRNSQLIDMVPSRSGSGPWTAPGFDTQQGNAAPAEGLTRAQVPEAVRGLLERLGKLGVRNGPAWDGRPSRQRSEDIVAGRSPLRGACLRQ